MVFRGPRFNNISRVENAHLGVRLRGLDLFQPTTQACPRKTIEMVQKGQE